MCAQNNSILKLAFNHIVLPPDLPDQSDGSRTDDVHASFVTRLLGGIATICGGADQLEPWYSLTKSLMSVWQVNEGGFVNKAIFLDALRKMKSGDAIMVFLGPQNACLFLRKPIDDDDQVIFEAFEASPAAGPTLAAKGALQCHFPGISVALKVPEFDSLDFQHCLTDFLEQASLEHVDEFSTKAHKAGVKVAEVRDTADPALITQFLMTLLEAQGSRVDVPILKKRVKDDVCWKNAELPWRRSPFWLSLRVFVQRILALHLDLHYGRLLYKALQCILLAQLLKDCLGCMEPEDSHILKVKLCRRLAKLHTENEQCSTSICGEFTQPLAVTNKFCWEIISVASSSLDAKWRSFKLDIERKVPLLPLTAMEEDMRISLPNSGSYLQRVLDTKGLLKEAPNPCESTAELRNHGSGESGEYEAFVAKYSSLTETELSIFSRSKDVPITKSGNKSLCKNLASQINDYINSVGELYRGNPEQMSAFILVIFQMWVELDQTATEAYPLLKEYHPLFEPALLDVLLLPQFSQLEQLQTLQDYLRKRCARARQNKMTIFEDPAPGCFADQYFEHVKADELQLLQQRIEDDCLKARNAKEKELERVNKRHETLTTQRAETPCTKRTLPDGSHDIRGCKHCYLTRCRWRLKITVHEDSLPSNEMLAEKRAIVFELNLPEDFAAYRQATWDIVVALARHDSPTRGRPEVLLGDYPQLNRYNQSQNPSLLTLASCTKSFLGTHFKAKKLPASLKNILLPFGLKLAYYDSQRGLWFKDLPKALSFSHHFALELSPAHKFSALSTSPDFDADTTGPTSYQVMANLLNRPADVNTQEFIAYQNLASGVRRRWFCLLIELGSSNLNFSLQDTTALIRRLALQAGPCSDGDILRDAHHPFRDPKFCLRLIEQIQYHVDVVASNWRESSYMESLLLLALRLNELNCAEVVSASNDLLLEIRRVTLMWIRVLRSEMRAAAEVDAAEQTARYCFLSALLCRQTFTCGLLGHEVDAEFLQGFVEATIAMQEAMVVDISKFTNNTRNLLVRDIKQTAIVGPQLRDLAMKRLGDVGLGINAGWPEESSSRVYTDWQFLPEPDHWWLHAKVPETNVTRTQEVRFHLLEGHLLIDGKSVGKLPAEIRDSQLLNDLFGNERLVAFPSNLPGSTYMLAMKRKEHSVHLGYRGDRLFIRAIKQGRVMELVPRQIFGSGSQMDLPSSWVERCFHWVYLDTGILEVRRHDRIWRESSWTLNIISRRAQRREAFLIDPHSRLFQDVARSFHHFEEPHMLTVIQPLRGNLCVELKRMDLTFHVNRKNLLQCQQLFAEIDPNQDPGTLYGLRSMLVLRDVFNRSQRSIITTMGDVRYQRHGMHVVVAFENNGSYARYSIEDVLGRLKSPPEPRLLYHKAHIHALTSCFIHDPLTGRTGTEEALSCLQSGLYKPWTPLGAGPIEILQRISKLTPQRKYYPENLKVQQSVHWDPDLTKTIQHDSYHSIVNILITKSNQLSRFYLQLTQPCEIVISADDHLRERSRLRRSILERTVNAPLELSTDAPYISRDHWCISKRTDNVREIAMMMQQRPPKMHTTKRLILLLQKSSIIGGYTESLSTSLEESLSNDLALEWGSLVRLCLDHRGVHDAKILFQLGLRAFGKEVNMEILRVILAFALLDSLQNLVYPSYSAFVNFCEREKPSTETILSNAKSLCPPYRERQGRKFKGRKFSKLHEVDYPQSEELYNLICVSECHKFAEHILQQWPSSTPSATGLELNYIPIKDAIESISEEWHRIYKNLQLFDHLKAVQKVLDDHWIASNEIPTPPTFKDCKIGMEKQWLYSAPQLDRLLGKEGHKLSLHYDTRSLDSWTADKMTTRNALSNPEINRGPEIEELEHIISRFTSSTCLVTSTYGKDLEDSVAALKKMPLCMKRATKAFDLDFGKNVQWLNDQIREAREIVDRHFRRLEESLHHGEATYPWLKIGSLWPVVTPITVLEKLRSSSEYTFGSGMKEMIVAFGKEVVNLQQLIRMKEALGKQDNEKLDQEYRNRGGNWDPSIYPDWLLLEVDSNMRIRPDQVTVAEEMIHPQSGSNSVLQMNMGQGKTSIIIPMIACCLADCNMMARIIVPGELLSQTAQVLQARLGGLLGKEIIHVPFSRRTPTSPTYIEVYRRLHTDILRESGVILEVPENLLSFRLSGLQRLSESKVEEAINMIEFQKWKDHNCRDILDESDATLAVKTQLVYPGGPQLALDGHPHRWEVIMTVLGLVAQELPCLARDYPKSIDIIQEGFSSFPIAHFLKSDVETALVRNLVETICYGGGGILPSHRCSHELRQILQTIITSKTISKSAANAFASIFPEDIQARKKVYLLRGLFTHSILLLTLKKRWNVQYGLHPQRFPIAVPFHAKGVPSDQAEWGHPDVSILLTCLSFYYQGLSEAQFRQSLETVLKSDDPAMEYDRWTQSSASLPDPLCHWNIINTDDRKQVNSIWRHLRFSTIVINYHLRTFIFPAYTQQFTFKIQASGWDVPLFSIKTQQRSTKRPGLTTGFSGTNDNRRLLPLTIQQQDLPMLLHTNAEVLTYLLQGRNREYIQAIDPSGKRISEVGLLRYLRDREIRILIDAGAFILEMDNKTLVRTWLQEDDQALAAVYFGQDNKPWVQYQGGQNVPLLATPFAENMKGCLVYLDEAHTRGTDLRLPSSARGALTLGLNQTKDMTVQAAMRLRQLGTNQSVTFIAPSEVHHSILDVCQKGSSEKLDSADVVTWLLHQTCVSNKQLYSLYCWQGMDFCCRVQAAATFHGFLSDDHHRREYLRCLQQPEEQTLEQLYKFRVLGEQGWTFRSGNDDLDFVGELRCIVKHLKRSYDLQVVDPLIEHWALEEVEQECEVAKQAEQERELQIPYVAEALKFPGLHRIIQHFVETGFLDAGDTCVRASAIMTSTALWSKHNMGASSMIAHVYMSPEFAKTVCLESRHESDNFIRPVNWVLFSMRSDVALIIIPEEAELIIPISRGLTDPPTHMILYAAPFTKRMLHFNRLDYYSLPPLPNHWTPPSWLPIELGLLAGRLYFTFAEYEDLRRQVLGNSREDGQLLTGEKFQMNVNSNFLQDWLSLRRPGQKISDTPMGYMCQNLALHCDHPFFSTFTGFRSNNELKGDALCPPVSLNGRQEEDESDGGESVCLDPSVEQAIGFDNGSDEE